MRSDAEHRLVDEFDEQYRAFEREATQRMRRAQGSKEKALCKDVIDAERQILVAQHQARISRLQASEIDPASPHADERIAHLLARAANQDYIVGITPEATDAEPSTEAQDEQTDS